jgi:hypothetical protein
MTFHRCAENFSSTAGQETAVSEDTDGAESNDDGSLVRVPTPGIEQSLAALSQLYVEPRIVPPRVGRRLR